ncbi:MAG: DUF1289 domain-containing protein [Kiloniellales bacterium]|nr:DUF1289 domain-containing protein [Kiloniellales bacterium]
MSENDPLSASQADDAAAARRRRREARRAARGRVIDHSVPSPCISVCQLDNGTGRCIGCYRTTDEIRDWPILSAEEKTAVLGRIALRKAGQDA